VPDEKMNSDEKKNITIDYAFILAILTGASYLLSFLFFSGKFSFYNIPLFLIELNINNITHSIVYLSPFVILIAWVTNIVLRESKVNKKETEQEYELSRKSQKKPPSNLYKIIISIIFIIIVIAIVLITLVINKSIFLGLLFGIIIDILVFFAILLYKNKQLIYLAILIYVVSSAFSFIYGYSIASVTKKYILVEENKATFISLTVYNEQFILAPFDKHTMNFRNEYKLMDMKDVKNFEMVNTGPIMIEK
jgi:hypothetical protein